MADEQETSSGPPFLAAGDKLRLARLRLGWTSRDLSARCAELGKRVDHGTIASWERGEGRPSPRNLFAVVQALGLDMDEMLAQYEALAAAA